MNNELDIQPPILFPYIGNNYDYKRIWKIWLSGNNKYIQYVLDNILEKPENITSDMYEEITLFKKIIQENRKQLKHHITDIMSKDSIQCFPEITDIIINNLSVSREELENARKIIFNL